MHNFVIFYTCFIHNWHGIPGSDLLLAAFSEFLTPSSDITEALRLKEGTLGEGNDDVLVAEGVVLLRGFLQHVVQCRVLVVPKRISYYKRSFDKVYVISAATLFSKLLFKIIGDCKTFDALLVIC